MRASSCRRRTWLSAPELPSQCHLKDCATIVIQLQRGTSELRGTVASSTSTAPYFVTQMRSLHSTHCILSRRSFACSCPSSVLSPTSFRPPSLFHLQSQQYMDIDSSKRQALTELLVPVINFSGLGGWAHAYLATSLHSIAYLSR